MKKFKILSGLIILTVLLVYSCSTIPVGISPSTTPLHNKVISTNMGTVEGEHRTYSIFCIWMIDKPDIDLAIANALGKKNGDALINVRCYKNDTWLLFIGLHSVTVVGEAVKLKEEEQKEEEEQEDEKK